MSSLRNAVKRVTHKERSQPQSRQHLGLLEKKTDYKLRSKDYHKKQSHLKSMRTKIANRNPDEFYFGMHRSKVDGMSGKNSGRHVKTHEARRIDMEEKGLGADAIKIMKDQDLAYIRMQRLMDGKKIEKLQSSLHYLEGTTTASSANLDDDDSDDEGSSIGKLSKKRKHTVFIEGSQKQVQDFNVAKHFDTIPELVGRAFNRPRIKTLEKHAMIMKLGKKKHVLSDDYYNNNESDDSDDDEYDEQGNPIQRQQLSEKQLLKKQIQQQRLEKRIAKSRSAAYTEMELRTVRLRKLQNAEAHLIVEKQTNMKGRKRKIEGKEDGKDGKPAVYKWRRKRAK